MPRKLSIGKPKYEGPYHDFPLVWPEGGLSEWVETLPIVDDDGIDTLDSENSLDLEKKKTNINERRLAISNKIAKLECIRDSIALLSTNTTKQSEDDNFIDDRIELKSDKPKYYVLENKPKNNTEEKQNQDKESIWQKVKAKTSDLYYKAGMYVGRAIFAAGNFSAGKLMAKPEMKIGENLVEYERRVKRIGMAKVLGLTVLSIFAVHGAKDIIDSFSQNKSINSEGVLKIDHSQFDNAINSNPLPSDINNQIPDFSFDAYNVTPGEGFYETMNQMGITDTTKQFDIIQRIGPQLQDMGVAYPMSDGTWGIANPGQLPKAALDLIWNNSQIT